MLNNATVHPTLAVTNMDRACEFYGNTLGLTEGSRNDNEAVFSAGGNTLVYVYLRGEPSGSTATACSFQVENIEATMDNLRSNGVTFEEYDFPGLKTENGIATFGDTRAAWFKDPDGNILAVGQGMNVGPKTATASASAN